MPLKNDLLKKGYLPENLPPAFSTILHAEFFDRHQTTEYFSRARSPVRPSIYSASKRGLTRRSFALIHPSTAHDLAHFTSTHWPETKTFLEENEFSLSIPNYNPNSDRAIEINTHSELESQRLKKLSRYRFIAKTDISRFYHSIYTHSIPWAFHGKQSGKRDRSPESADIFYNRADLILRCGQDGQTISIPVGPDASRIIAETVSCGIDAAFRRRNDVADCTVLRHVDDVWIGANSHADAERALWRYREAIREYELDINESKTRIYSEDFRFSDSWPTEIASQLDFALSSSPRRVPERLRTALEHAFSLSAQTADDGILKYAIRYLDKDPQGWLYWETLEPFLKRAVVHFGHTIDYVSRVIVWKHLTRRDLDIHSWTTILTTTLDRHGRLGNDSEVCWTLYACIRLGITIPLDIAGRIFENCSAVTSVAMFNCAERELLNPEAFGLAIGALAGENSSGPLWPLLSEWTVRRWPGYQQIDLQNDLIIQMVSEDVTLCDMDRLPVVFQNQSEVDFSSITKAIEKRISLYDDEDFDDEPEEDENPF